MTFYNMPNDLFNAFEHAYRVINWQENMLDDECPEPWKWHLDWEIEEHFKVLKSRREAKKQGWDPEVEEDENWERNVFFDRAREGSLFE